MLDRLSKGRCLARQRGFTSSSGLIAEAVPELVGNSAKTLGRERACRHINLQSVTWPKRAFNRSHFKHLDLKFIVGIPSNQRNVAGV